jgi:anti-sigma factor RsiW
MRLTRWFKPRRHTELVCREAVELVTAYLDEALEPGQRAALERHLAGCPHCHEYFAQIQAVRQTAARVEPEDLPADARRDLMALYLQWRDDPELQTDVDL